jgi:capping protein beta
MEERRKIQDCIGLVRKLPIIKMEDNITAISNLIYEDDDLLNEFLQKVDSRIEISPEDGEFLMCEHNRDGDSYRSPLSNQYFPQVEDGRLPTPELRELEIKLNKMFGLYAKAYYSISCKSSCYCWELGDSIEDGFAVAVLVKNLVDLEKEVDSGKWESNNVVNVTFNKAGDKIEATYKLTTSVVLQMNFDHKVCGKVCLSGTVSRQMQETYTSKTYLNDEFHVTNIGNMIEDCENSLRNTIEEIYIKKSKEVSFIYRNLFLYFI